MQGLDIAQQKTKMRFSASHSSYRKPQSVCRLLSYLSLYDSNLTTIVATRWANSVVKVESTAVAALSERRSYSSIMGATLEGTIVVRLLLMVLEQVFSLLVHILLHYFYFLYF